jgi:SPX domain protein involved in polyphosphate accumulation
MRFGQRVHCMQIPQWAPFYFNYNAFKRIVKTALTRDSEAEAKAQSIGLSTQEWAICAHM